MHGSAMLLKEKKKGEDERKPQFAGMAFLPFLTFQPFGNPLANLIASQRRIFFESAARDLHLRRLEHDERARQAGGWGGRLPLLAGHASQAYAGASLAAQAGKEKSGVAAQGWLEGGVAPESEKERMLAYGSGFREVRGLHERTVFLIDDYARGDPEKASAVLSDFRNRLERENYGQQDAIAVLLLAIEDNAMGGEEGSAGEAHAGHFGAGMRLRRRIEEVYPGQTYGPGAAAAKPGPSASGSARARLRVVAKDASEVRLASVREMLRHYFLRHPEEYRAALAAALGLTADQEDDAEFIQERLAHLFASIGGFALAQRLLAQARTKMGEKECMRKLGCARDWKSGRLIISRRACSALALGRKTARAIPAGAKGESGRKAGGLRTAPSRPRRRAARD